MHERGIPPDPSFYAEWLGPTIRHKPNQKNMIFYPGLMVGLTSEIPTQAREWRNQREVFKWCRQNTLLTQNQHDQWMQNLPDDVKMFGIVGPSGEPVGVCGLTNIDNLARHAEFSLYIAPEHQKNGYGFDALVTLFKHGFEDFNLHKIWGETFWNNPAIKLFQKIGMILTRGHTDHYFKGGEYISTSFITLLREDWDEGKFSYRNFNKPKAE